jgi:hypothetical protein
MSFQIKILFVRLEIIQAIAQALFSLFGPLEVVCARFDAGQLENNSLNSVPEFNFLERIV